MPGISVVQSTALPALCDIKTVNYTDDGHPIRLIRSVLAFLGSYRVFGQLDITRSSSHSLHDSQRSAQISTSPEERHPFEHGMYAL